MAIDEHSVHIVGMGGTLGRNSINLWSLQRALQAAEQAGATTEILSLSELDLPMFQPDVGFEQSGDNIVHFIETVRRADGMIWSTAVYHGTLAGVTKNALDYFEYTRLDPIPYLSNKPVGLIATAGGDTGASNAINAMVHVVQSMHGLVIPRTAAIERAGNVFDRAGVITDDRAADRLDIVGKLVVNTALRLKSHEPIFPDAHWGDLSW